MPTQPVLPKRVLRFEYFIGGGVRLRLAATVALAATALAPVAAQAAIPALKIAPLEYQQQLPLGTAKIGYITVSNPTDTTIQVISQVQAFRQIDTQGDLQFYNDARVQAGIIPDLPEFQLGPRAAVNMAFRIDPNKLGPGGTYAAVFLQTVPDDSAAGNDITPSVRVGTLMVLTVGNGGVEQGKISKLTTSFVHFGSGVSGTLNYTNVGTGAHAIAFNPHLNLVTGLFGRPQGLNRPLVLPQSTRVIAFSHRGSYLGLVRIAVVDADNHASGVSVWVLACTGYWRWLLPLIVLVGVVVYRERRRVQGAVHRLSQPRSPRPRRRRPRIN